MKSAFLSACIVATTVFAGQCVAADVVAIGLNNPRGIAFGPDGNLYVAEAGTGGTGSCIVTSDRTTRCFGTTGSIMRITLPALARERVLTGLPSIAGPSGASALGPAGISFQGLGNGFFTLGLGANPAHRSDFGPGGALLAHEARMIANGTWRLEADLGTYEAIVNPAGGPADTDPFGIVTMGGKQVITDAGGNDLLEVSANGAIRTLAVFPNQLVPAPGAPGALPPPGATVPAESVPTSVAIGPDGAYYVGELTGFPFYPGSANVYRVPAEGGAPTVAYFGFTNIIGVAFGPDGSLYVLEISKHGLRSGDPHGALYKVAADGSRVELAKDELFMPGGLAISPTGTIYVTNWSVSPGGGQVLKIEP